MTAMRNLLILLFLATSVSGCASYELMRVRNDLARQAPEARIGDGYAMSFGRISLGLASWLAGLGGDEDAEMARVVLSEVRRVQFARYDVNGAFELGEVKPGGYSLRVRPAGIRNASPDLAWVDVEQGKSATNVRLVYDAGFSIHGIVTDTA